MPDSRISMACQADAESSAAARILRTFTSEPSYWGSMQKYPTGRGADSAPRRRQWTPWTCPRSRSTTARRPSASSRRSLLTYAAVHHNHDSIGRLLTSLPPIVGHRARFRLSCTSLPSRGTDPPAWTAPLTQPAGNVTDLHGHAHRFPDLWCGRQRRRDRATGRWKYAAGSGRRKLPGSKLTFFATPQHGPGLRVSCCTRWALASVLGPM